MQLLLIFIGLNILNVILHTANTIVTIKGSKLASALTAALTYGVYTVVIIYTMCDLPLALKAIIVALCNFVGVIIVKSIEQTMRKDKLWRIELSVPNRFAETLKKDLQDRGVSFNSLTTTGRYTIYNCYCPTQKESAFVKEICDRHHVKYFVTESKVL